MVVFEKDDRLGGLLRYGIPDFKLEKRSSTAAWSRCRGEGVKFEPGVDVGRDITAGRAAQPVRRRSACAWAPAKPRPLNVPGADLRGVHFAMDFLSQQNRRVAGDDQAAGKGPVLTAKGKHVIVVGGGDTGSDCVGTSIRQGAISVTQLEILPKPPEGSNDETPWPHWPKIMRTSSSQEEGCERRWSVLDQGPSRRRRPRPRTLRHRGQLAPRCQGLGDAGDSRHRVHSAGRSGADRHGLRARRARPAWWKSWA